MLAQKLKAQTERTRLFFVLLQQQIRTFAATKWSNLGLQQNDMTQENNFTALAEKPIGALLRQYALPAIIAMLASSLYNIIDGIFIGQGVGGDAITGLALTFPIMALTAAFGAMVGMGGATLMSLRLGQQDYDSARRILGNVVLLNITLGLVLGATLLLLIDPILRSFGASDATLPYAREYMRILMYGNVFTHMYFGLNAQLRSTNRPKKAMYATFATVILNTFLNALFIFGFGWGIAGAAWATVLSQVLVLSWQIRLFSNPNDLIHLSKKALRPNFKIMREALVIGLPQFLVNACASLVSIVITRSMAEYGGDAAVGAFGISNRILMLTVFIVMGLNQGMQPIAGYNFGAKRYDRVITAVKYTTIAATIVMTFGFLMCEIFAEQLVSVFATDAPELMAEAARGLRIAVLMFPFVGMQIVSSVFFQSIGMPAKSILLSLTRQMIFFLPGVLILPQFFEHAVDGVWYAMPVSDLAATLLSAVLFIHQLRKLKLQTPSL